jgi:hypothetical protein
MKKRLLAVGCSFTYGEELPDPRTQAWPALIAEEFDYDLVNLGACGASNDYIFRQAIEYTVDDRYDLVVIQWTEPSRMEVWHELKQQTVNVSANPAGGFVVDHLLSWVKPYYKYSYNELFAFRNWAVKIIALQNHFKSRGQPYVMVSISGLNPKGHWRDFQAQLTHLWSQVDSDNYPGWPHVGLKEWYQDTPLAPGGHPLQPGHRKIADEIRKHIRN